MAHTEIEALPRAALTVTDFCKAHSIGRTRFYQEVAAGRIKVLKCGRRTLIPTSQSAAWLASLEAGGAAKAA